MAILFLHLDILLRYNERTKETPHDMRTTQNVSICKSTETRVGFPLLRQCPFCSTSEAVALTARIILISCVENCSLFKADHSDGNIPQRIGYSLSVMVFVSFQRALWHNLLQKAITYHLFYEVPACNILLPRY